MPDFDELRAEPGEAQARVTPDAEPPASGVDIRCRQGCHRVPIERRFFDKLVIGDDCWGWLGTHTRGYASIGRGGGGNGSMYAHRLSYELFKGPIPAGLEIDHLCRNKECTNPDHLEAVTHRENGVRGIGRQSRALHTHCARGHQFTPENTYVYPSGRRNCMACRRERDSR